jgi:hypothetical protein
VAWVGPSLRLRAWELRGAASVARELPWVGCGSAARGRCEHHFALVAMCVLTSISRDSTKAFAKLAGLALVDAPPAAVPSPLVMEDDEVPADDDVGGDCFTPARSTRKAVPRVISNLRPARMLEGTSGVYLLTNEEGVGVAVFKPLDEENLPVEASTWAVTNGMGHFRERAAFVVSDEVLKGYSGVPDTVIATVKHEGWAGGEKRGSLQRFVPASSDMSDRGPANIPAEEVQKVGILDILLFNMDRHEGNLLLCSKQEASQVLSSKSLSLVPIDHGLCLPEIISQHAGPNHELLRSIYFVWQNWPQARQPFSDTVRRLLDRQLKDDLFRTVIANLVEDMGRNSLTCGALTTLKIGAMVLRNAVKSGLNLSEIANLVSTALAGLLQQSWEKVDEEMRKIVKTEGQEKETQHSAADDNKQDAAAAGEAVQKEMSVVPYIGPSARQAGASFTVSVEDEDAMYPMWEMRLLASLEKQLSVLLSAHTAASAGNPASAAATSEHSEDIKEAEIKEGVEVDGGNHDSSSSSRLSNAELCVHDRIQYLDDSDSAISADEDEGATSARTITTLRAPDRGLEGNTTRRRSHSSRFWGSASFKPCYSRRARGRPMPRTDGRNPRHRPAVAPAEPMLRGRGGRRDEMMIRILLDQLESKGTDRDNAGAAPNTASDCRRYQGYGNGLADKTKVGKKDEKKSAPSDAASINLLAPRVFKNVCA